MNGRKTFPFFVMLARICLIGRVRIHRLRSVCIKHAMCEIDFDQKG